MCALRVLAACYRLHYQRDPLMSDFRSQTGRDSHRRGHELYGQVFVALSDMFGSLPKQRTLIYTFSLVSTFLVKPGTQLRDHSAPVF